MAIKFQICKQKLVKKIIVAFYFCLNIYIHVHVMQLPKYGRESQRVVTNYTFINEIKQCC